MRKNTKRILSVYKEILPIYKKIFKVMTYVSLLAISVVLLVKMEGIDIIGVDGNDSKVYELLFLMSFMILISNISINLVEYLINRMGSQDEYRRYWVRELERDDLKVDKSNKVEGKMAIERLKKHKKIVQVGR